MGLELFLTGKLHFTHNSGCPLQFGTVGNSKKNPHLLFFLRAVLGDTQTNPSVSVPALQSELGQWANYA